MKFKKVKEVNSPTSSYKSDAGFDVYSPTDEIIYPGFIKQVKLGIAIEIEENEVAMMCERSGQAIKYGIASIGQIIDSGYRGEISAILLNSGSENYYIHKGDKIAQIVVLKLGSREIKEVKELTEADRGDNAHYSSGK
jgi:dUTP pyrophosphatase